MTHASSATCVMSEYTDAVERGLRGLTSASVGACPGCEQCRDMFAPDATMEEFDEMWHKGELCYESSFSYLECGICGSYLGGDRCVWHWLADDNEVQHEDDCCFDCAMYMANGDEPENWRRR